MLSSSLSHGDAGLSSEFFSSASNITIVSLVIVVFIVFYIAAVIYICITNDKAEQRIDRKAF